MKKGCVGFRSANSVERDGSIQVQHRHKIVNKIFKIIFIFIGISFLNSCFESDRECTIQNGIMKTYYDKNELFLKSEYNMKNCIVDGDYKEYYINGKLFADGQTREGKRIGRWNFYNQNNKTFCSQEYNEEGILDSAFCNTDYGQATFYYETEIIHSPFGNFNLKDYNIYKYYHNTEYLILCVDSTVKMLLGENLDTLQLYP
jgi:hypothetical protein